MRRFLRAGLLVLLSTLGGCATAVRTPVDYVYVITEPAGADARTSTGMSCTTPCTFIMPRSADFEVSISREGYQTWSGRVSRVRKGANSPFDSAPAQAAAGAAAGGTAGLAAAGATGELGLTLAGGLGATEAGAAMVTTGVLAGALIPLGVDAATGANRDFSPNPLRVTLALKEEASPP